MMKMMALVILVSLLSLFVYIRLAPSDPARWHIELGFDENYDLPGGAGRVIEGNSDTFAKLDRIVADTPRTHVLAGSVDKGHVTYVTRSAGFGFPDYTTMQLDDGQIMIFGRLRFGKADFGVNAARIDGWAQEAL